MDENQIEEFDSQTELVDDTENQPEESDEQSDEEAEKLREQNKRLFERAKKAEEQLKTLKVQAQPTTINNQPADISEELRLIAKGLSDDEIEQAKVIAKGSGTNLSEALKSPLFVAFQKEIKDAERKERAKLGASRGSGQSEPEKGFQNGLTREQHMALWKETQA